MKIKINISFEREFTEEELESLGKTPTTNQQTTESFVSHIVSNYVEKNILDIMRNAVLNDDQTSKFLEHCDCIDHGKYMDVGCKIFHPFSWPKQVIRKGVKWSFMNQYDLGITDLSRYGGKAVYINDGHTENTN